jgi:hypothetical protein
LFVVNSAFLMLTVHIRITDAASGKPTPARLRLTDADGRYYAPFGRLTEFATGVGDAVGGNLLLGGQQFAYIDGACEVRLPAGPITVEASRGPEFSPLRRTVTLGPGQISLRLDMQRWIDLRAEGWHPGDTRSLYLSPHAALLEGAAEDLAVVNLLALEAAGATPNLLAFSGGKPALETAGCHVVVNTLNVHPILGAVALLNCHRVVHPLRSGAPGPDDWALSDWCDQCHRKKTGLVVLPDLPRLTPEQPQGEALAAALAGRIDAFEISRFDDPEPATLADWYRLLDCGLRLPLAGGGGKDSNAVALGAVRTYARLTDGEPFSYAAWIEAIRTGRTFVTNGPLLTLHVEDQPPGAVIRLPAAGGAVRIRTEARSAAPFERVEILLNGSVLASKEASGNRQATVLETEHHLTASGWLAVRAWGRDRLLDGQCVYAHTSPIYLDVEGRPLRPSHEAIAPLEAVLERTLDWVKRAARTPSEGLREQLVATLEAARGGLVAVVGTPSV